MKKDLKNDKLGNKKEILEELDALCKLIMLLDGLRAFRRVKPEIVKAIFANLKSKDIAREWSKIEKDIEKIAYMPLNIPKIKTWMKTALILRYLFIIATVPSFLLFMSRFVSKSIVINIDERISISVLLIPLISGQLSLILDFLIRRKISRYEETHPEKYLTKKTKIKATVQLIIKKVVKLMKIHGEKPEKHILTLYFNDYDNIKIISKSRGKIFKRKYYIYKAVVSL
ncbi:MAG: hypothetical protein QXO15_08540 [Nitrososphaerota archaeon]